MPILSSLPASGVLCAPPRKSPKRSVRFSETSSMRCFDCPSKKEVRRRWYSREERDSLKREFLQDLRYMARRLATTPIERVGSEDLVMCVGMESMLSHDISRGVRERKRYHRRLILSAQARQDSMDIVDEEELRYLSEESSKWTRERSQALAEGYWMTLNDTSSSR